MRKATTRRLPMGAAALLLVLSAGVACGAPEASPAPPTPTPTAGPAPSAPAPASPPVAAPTPAPASAPPTASAPPAPSQRQGEAVYLQSCAGCHVADGTGNPGIYPPLAGSEWVVGEKGRLVRILLHGLMGPIMVAGEEYQGVMPGWAGALTDAQIAALSTYIRSSWGNIASEVTAAEVAAIRNAEAGRTAFWTAAELMRVPAP